MRMKLLWAMLAAYGMSAFIGILAVLSQDSNVARLLVTSLVVSGSFTALLLLALLREFGARSLRWLMVTGMILTLPTGLLGLVLIWGSFRDDLLPRTAVGLTVFVLWCLYTGYCFSIPARAAWFRTMTIGLFAAAVFYLLLILGLLIDEKIVEHVIRVVFRDEELFVRGLVALIVLSIAGSLALPVIWLIARLNSGPDSGMESAVEVALSCPRCGLEQRLETNGARCGRCKLEIRIRLEEPRCDCGFLLYRFEGDTCPECGRPVPESARWAVPAG